jgi:hypothetical protein
MTSSNNIDIYDSLGFRASTWRSGDQPGYETYGQNPPVFYTGEPYMPNNPTVPNPGPNFSANLTDLYGRVFWNTFFQTLFPQIAEQNFLNEKSTGTPGGYFTQLYQIAMRDFYDSFFRGRDDLGSNSLNQLTTPQTWASMTYDDQRLTIKKYLYTRSNIASTSYLDQNGTTIMRDYTGNMLLKDLSLRSTNVFFYVAALMVRVMGQLQENTINAGRYATRLSETQKTIATEMTNPKYNYLSLEESSHNDYARIRANEQNNLTLENLRMYRDQIQKETDQASNFLESSQQGVEEQGSKALEFLKKGQELTQLFYRGL